MIKWDTLDFPCLIATPPFMRTLSSTDLRANLSAVMDRVNDDHDPKLVPACKLDLDLPFGCITPRRFMTGMIDNLDREKTGSLRRRLPRPRRKPRVTQPFEDQIGIQPISPRDLRDRYIRRRRLKADRPLLVIRPKPPRSTATRNPMVLTTQSGHYLTLYRRGRAVTPDAYRSPPKGRLYWPGRRADRWFHPC